MSLLLLWMRRFGRRPAGMMGGEAPAPGGEAGVNSIVFLFLRRMRTPLLVLIAVYTVSIIGLILIPGVDADGRPWRFDLFHAFYFISYTGSTIGFGELPYAFTPAQRLWVTVTIYLSVIGWLYAVGNILALVQDPAFQRALAESRFAARVRGLGTPFYIICGYGQSGSLLVRALCRRGVQPVVLDADGERLARLELEDLGIDVPWLAAGIDEARILRLAGLLNPRCLGVVAISSVDAIDVKVAITARLLNPRLLVVARAEHAATAANLRSFETQDVVDPYATFGEHLAMALDEPSLHMLYEYLVRMPGLPLPARVAPPRGHWIVCGYGRFGRAAYQHLSAAGVPVTVIEESEATALPAGSVLGRATEAEPLRNAGAHSAIGLIAGTDDDSDNLSIVYTARLLNPQLYVVGRVNRIAEEELFTAAGVDLLIAPHRLVVWRVLGELTVPLVNRFLTLAQRRGEDWARPLLARLEDLCAGCTPDTWEIALDARQAPAVVAQLLAGRTVRLGELLRDAQNRAESMPVMTLLLLRAGCETLLPGEDLPLIVGDRLLFAGRAGSESRLDWTLGSVKTLEYLLDGVEHPDGYVWRWLARRRGD